MATLLPLTITLDIVIVGGLVLESGETFSPNGNGLGLAAAKLTSWVPANVNNSAEIRAIGRSAFSSTSNPCFNTGFAAVKGFLSRFLDQASLKVSQTFLTIAISLFTYVCRV